MSLTFSKPLAKNKMLITRKKSPEALSKLLAKTKWKLRFRNQGQNANVEEKLLMMLSRSILIAFSKPRCACAAAYKRPARLGPFRSLLPAAARHRVPAISGPGPSGEFILFLCDRARSIAGKPTLQGHFAVKPTLQGHLVVKPALQGCSEASFTGALFPYSFAEKKHVRSEAKARRRL